MNIHATPAISSSIPHQKRPVASALPGLRTRTGVRAGFVVVREPGSGSAETRS